MLDTRSPLMKRLAEIMPKKPEKPWEPWDGKSMMHIDLHPIRMSADAFASWLNDELPANDEELRAMLWTFGEILNGEMERMLNVSNRLQSDLLATLPIKPTWDGIFVKDMEDAYGIPLFKKGATDGT